MDHMEKYEQWLSSPYIDEEDKEELRELTPEEIRDRFYTDLSFGTAGVRGIRGVGTNRMNKYVIRKVTQAYALFLKRIYDRELNGGVILAFDCRIMSEAFAREAAGVLSANGIKVWIYDDVSSTPEISYAIRTRKAAGGMMFTASHNPPEYNGCKAYNALGCQLSDEQGELVFEELEGLRGLEDVLVDPEEKLVKLLPGSVRTKFLREVRHLHKGKANRSMTVAYTPLHGVGGEPTKMLFDKLGYNLEVVESQFAPNGNFPTVRKPNPEEEGAMKLLIEKGKEVDADLLMAADPDADRLGVMVLHEGKYVTITGNQLGALVVDYLIRTRHLEPHTYIIKTVVTSDLCSAIAKRNNVGVVNTLTGYKYIGTKMQQLLDEGKNVLFSFEESIGYLPGTYIRDKDSFGAAVLVAEMTGALLAEGKTLVDQLEELYGDYGYYIEDTMNIVLEGEEGKKLIHGLMQLFRDEGIDSQGTLDVAHMQDFLRDIEGFPKSNVLRYYLKNHSWLAVRPSGTEPKIKIYISAVGTTRDEAELNLQLIEKAVNEKVHGYLNER